MRHLLTISALIGLAAALGCTGPSTNSSDGLEGAGSTFVYNLMSHWTQEYAKAPDGCPVRYRAWGSEGGIKFILEKRGDFGCTDAPLTDKELSRAHAAGGDLLHIPLVLGADVAAYNLPEVAAPLRFTGPVLANIFLGKVTRWNDEAIQKLNPDVKLPDKPIVTVHRRDGSGTTDIWTDYLSKVSPEWQKGPGAAWR